MGATPQRVDPGLSIALQGAVQSSGAGALAKKPMRIGGANSLKTNASTARTQPHIRELTTGSVLAARCEVRSSAPY